MVNGPDDVPRHVIDRVYERSVELPSGCIESTYSTGSHGYPQVGWHTNGKVRTTTCSRVVWIDQKDEIPSGFFIDQTCRNRRCINIEHLRMQSQAENSADIFRGQHQVVHPDGRTLAVLSFTDGIVGTEEAIQAVAGVLIALNPTPRRAGSATDAH